MADEIAVAALVRKRAELAGRIAHARRELDAMLAGLAALDATLRLFDPGIRVEGIKPKRFRPRSGEPAPGMRSRDVLVLLRRAGEPLDAREIAARLLAEAGRSGDERLLERARESVRKALGRHRARGLVACEPGAGQCAAWRLILHP